jgi:hypothetical protein
MVVDIVVYSLILPSSLFGFVHEENGAKLVLREDQKERLFQSRAAGEGRDGLSLHNTRRNTA